MARWLIVILSAPLAIVAATSAHAQKMTELLSEGYEIKGMSTEIENLPSSPKGIVVHYWTLQKGPIEYLCSSKNLYICDKF